MQGDVEHASMLIEIMGNFFKDYENSHPNSGIMSQYYVMRGVAQAAAAQADFRIALQIRLDKERYPIGEARARAGIAATALAQGDVRTFSQESIRTLLCSPLILLQR
jgi:hypothetical protein